MIYIIAESIHYLMKLESVFKKENVEFELRPNPSELISSCGLCISFKQDILQTVLSIFASGLNREFFSFYKREKDGFVKLDI